MIEEAVLFRYPGSNPAMYYPSEWVCFEFRNAKAKTIDGYVDLLKREEWKTVELTGIDVKDATGARFFKLTRRFPDGECLIALRETV